MSTNTHTSIMEISKLLFLQEIKEKISKDGIASHVYTGHFFPLVFSYIENMNPIIISEI